MWAMGFINNGAENSKMFALKQKYFHEDVTLFIAMSNSIFYMKVVFDNYRGLHQLRNVLSPIGVNGFIIGYIVIGLLCVLEEVLLGDVAARGVLLVLLATQVLYDMLFNFDVLRVAIRSETEHYLSEFVMYEDQLNFAQRMEQLTQQGRTKELKTVRRVARNFLPTEHLRWIGAVRIREKGAGQSWLVQLTDGDDYEAHVVRQQRKFFTHLLAVFQEVRDRGLSPKRREQVLQRLERYYGIHIEPCCS